MVLGAQASHHSHLVPKFPRCPMRMVMVYYPSDPPSDEEHFLHYELLKGRNVYHFCSLLYPSKSNGAPHIVCDHEWLLNEDIQV